jgi:hypothetical protein
MYSCHSNFKHRFEGYEDADQEDSGFDAIYHMVLQKFPM